METTLFEIKFLDGRIFNVFCHGKNQKKRFMQSTSQLENIEYIKVALNGIHTIKEFETIMNNEQ